MLKLRLRKIFIKNHSEFYLTRQIMISNEELKNLSKLARIDIKDEELLGLSKDINSILDYVGQVSQMGADKKSQINANIKNEVLENVTREDKNPHKSGKFRDDLLKEVPDIKDGYVKVKKIL